LTPRGRTSAGRRTRQRRSAAPIRYALVVVFAVGLFGLGIGFGQALRDRDQPGGKVTRVRTLKPLPVAPVQETVTVTVTTG